MNWNEINSAFIPNCAADKVRASSYQSCGMCNENPYARLDELLQKSGCCNYTGNRPAEEMFRRYSKQYDDPPVRSDKTFSQYDLLEENISHMDSRGDYKIVAIQEE